MLQGSGLCLPVEAVCGREDPVLMNEGTPADVEEAGLWTALGPDLQQTSKALGRDVIFTCMSILPRVSADLYGHLPGPGVRPGPLSVHDA